MGPAWLPWRFARFGRPRPRPRPLQPARPNPASARTRHKHRSDSTDQKPTPIAVLRQTFRANAPNKPRSPCPSESPNLPARQNLRVRALQALISSSPARGSGLNSISARGLEQAGGGYLRSPAGGSFFENSSRGPPVPPRRARGTGDTVGTAPPPRWS